ncbi:MAG: response regulator [Bacteroidales bacterium]|jgi:CheY-like chemotaxis protein|nr:response regulator [Bacteroidales bacterium]
MDNLTDDWSSKSILIVEDDLFSTEYLVEALSETKAEIKIAKDGTTAIQLVKETPTLDLILMDIQLPGISGEEATKKIREFNRQIPIIAQTAHAMAKDKEKYLAAGCNDYLSKPILVTDLFEVLRKYLH